MYTKEQEWALEQFEELASKLGSQNKACAQVGISAAIMSPLKKGTYSGDANAQFGKLLSYFTAKEEAAATPSAAAVTGYVPTSISSQVYGIIRYCQLKGGLGVIAGDAGIGKTMACKQFVQDHPQETVYLALNPCLASVKSAMKALCSQCNVSERTTGEMWLGLVNKLRDGMVIIIDEAQHLPIKTVEALRSMSDYFTDAGQTLGIVFVGSRELINSMGTKKEFAQIRNRSKRNGRYETTDVTRKDIQLIFSDLDKDSAEIDFLLAVARGEEAIRGAVNLYNAALDNNNASYAGLVAAAKDRKSEVRL